MESIIKILQILLLVCLLHFLFIPLHYVSADIIPSFSQHEYSVENIPLSISTGYFNDDDIIDIITIDSEGNISIILGVGDGSFGDAITTSTGIPTVYNIGVEDFNIDGFDDVFVKGLLLLSDGYGTFSEVLSLAADVTTSRSADVNNDGNADIIMDRVYTEQGTEKYEVLVHLGNGDGTFMAPISSEIPGTGLQYTGDGNYYEVIVTNLRLRYTGDFNSDGNTDLIVGWLKWVGEGFFISEKVIIIGNGDGTFDEVIKINLEGLGGFYGILPPKDFNGDKKLDLIGTSGVPDLVKLMKGDGKGNFTTIYTYQYDDGPYAKYRHFILDANKDNFWDIGMICETSIDGLQTKSELNFFIGNDNGTLEGPFVSAIDTISANDKLSHEMSADFNNDGYDDFVSLFDKKSYVKVFINDGISSFVETNEASIPPKYYLGQNFPNPFNSATTIRFSLPHTGFVDLSIYSLVGQRIRNLVSGKYSEGLHSVVWDGKDDKDVPVSSGIYLYELRAGDLTVRKKMLLIY